MLRSTLSAFFLLAAAAGIAACDPGQVPPAPGEICLVDGKAFRPGESFPSPDGCNSCSCQVGGQVACTDRACTSDAGAPPVGCFYGGKTYKPGDRFPSTDGCNSCFCGENGAVGCTKKACPAPKACQVGGCSGQICSDEPLGSTCEWRDEYACYKGATCERQADGVCGWTKTPELAACLSKARPQGAFSGTK